MSMKSAKVSAYLILTLMLGIFCLSVAQSGDNLCSRPSEQTAQVAAQNLQNIKTVSKIARNADEFSKKAATLTVRLEGCAVHVEKLRIGKNAVLFAASNDIPLSEIYPSLVKRKASPESALNFIFPAISERLEDSIRRFEKETVPSEVVFSPNADEKFSYVIGSNGFVVDRNKLYRDIGMQVGNDQIRVNCSKVFLPCESRADLLNRTRLRSTFATKYSTSSSGRKHNIKLAASALNGTVISSKQFFSFNTCVGARSAERGYQTAKIIIDGEFVDGTGGGVCQVSTTLYNAALLAGLTVCQAQAHSLPVGYVPYSRDAMVSSVCDLRLYNPLPFDVYIETVADGNTLKVNFYGKQGDRIAIESELICSIPFEQQEEIDLSLASGETRVKTTGKNGVKSCAYICVYRGEKMVSRKRLRCDTYKPITQIVSVAPNKDETSNTRSAASADASEAAFAKPFVKSN